MGGLELEEEERRGEERRIVYMVWWGGSPRCALRWSHIHISPTAVSLSIFFDFLGVDFIYMFEMWELVGEERKSEGQGIMRL